MELEKKKKIQANLLATGITFLTAYPLIYVVLIYILEHMINEKMSAEHIYDMKLYLILTITSILFELSISLLWLLLYGVIILIIGFLLFMLIVYLMEKINIPSVLQVICGKCLIIFGCILLCFSLFKIFEKTLFVPYDDIKKYVIAGEMVTPVMAVNCQYKDLYEEPMEIVISDCKIVEYRTRDSQGYEHKKYFISYDYNGKSYCTPAIDYFRRELSDSLIDQDAELSVLVYPNTGVVLDFVEKPLSASATNEVNREILLEKYGLPYVLTYNEIAQINISRSSKYPNFYYDECRIYFDCFWISYNGEEAYFRSGLENEENNIFTDYDGVYEITLGRRDGSRLSNTLTYVVKDQYIVDINGESTFIAIYDPIRPADEDEIYSKQMQEFIDIADMLMYNIDYSSYHINPRSKEPGSECKYLYAFNGYIPSSIQVYECKDELAANYKFEDWIYTYATEVIESSIYDTYAIRSSLAKKDDGILVKKDNFVYVFRSDSVNEAKSIASEFGCYKMK